MLLHLCWESLLFAAIKGHCWIKMNNLELIGFAVEVERIEERLSILNSNNSFEGKEISRLMLRLEAILFELEKAQKQIKPKFQIIKGGSNEHI
jgi:hypothetical protein